MRSEFEKTVVLDDFDPLEYAWFDPKRNRYIPYSRDEVCLDASMTLNAGWDAWQFQQLKLDEANKFIESAKMLVQKWWEQSKEKHEQGKVWESKVLGECADVLLDELEQALKGENK
ncbi:hypothetical protein OQ601_06195 [Acinetobacter baumannii]|uniref:hypothetical protein n=1 Tax=Acinetobacter baumannii TaxID=470 RepID=UPI0022477F09|nr:hypothetical protein [Acinetobacter baumannii]MCX2426749.1 hypothetical protein [Acinetobacter baumannii]